MYLSACAGIVPSIEPSFSRRKRIAHALNRCSHIAGALLSLPGCSGDTLLIDLRGIQVGEIADVVAAKRIHLVVIDGELGLPARGNLLGGISGDDYHYVYVTPVEPSDGVGLVGRNVRDIQLVAHHFPVYGGIARVLTVGGTTMMADKWPDFPT